MLSSVPPNFKPIRCKLNELLLKPTVQNCAFGWKLKMPPFVAGERYSAALLIVWRPYITEESAQISAESNHRVPSKTAIMVAVWKHQNTRKQLTPLEIRQSDRSTAIKLNERTPCYLRFYQRSSPSDVNSPTYSAINCKIRYELKVPPFVTGER